VYNAVGKFRLYEQIVQQIEESILKGTLRPGDQLPAERDLASQFGVSRTAIREAVKVLQEKGLVEARAGKGTFVTSSTADAVRQTIAHAGRTGQPSSLTHLVEIREIFEPEIAAIAATQADEQHIAGMREAYAVMDRSRRDPQSFIEADLDFHLLLAEATGNPIILSLIDSIVGQLREQRTSIFQVEGGPERGQVHHKAILEAVERRDSEAAREAMRSHLKQVRDDCLREPEPSPASAKPLSPTDAV
jgi:GntR family transcriptional repressor for pyruvate dehydrogenase complex